MATLLIVLGAVCAAYGISVMLVWSGSAFFVVWLAGGAVLAGAGLLMRFGVWQGLPAVLRIGSGAVAVVGAIAVVGTAAFIMTRSWAAPPAGLDYVIVLGAQVRGDRTPSTVLRYRLDTAVDYLAANPGTRCIVSGGQGPNEPCPEAEAMADYLQEHGIATERIQLEDRSTNTVENIRFSRDLVEAGEGAGAGAAGTSNASVGIVTNDFHVFRAAAIARKQGLAGAVGIAAPSDPWFLPNNLLREVAGVWKDALLGNL